MNTGSGKPYTVAIVLAAGIGARMKSDKTKQKMLLLGKSILKRSVLAFSNSSTIDQIIVVCRADEIDFVKGEVKDISKPIEVVVGAATRAESAIRGVDSVEEEKGFVLIHDAARCLITPDDIDKVSYAVYQYGAATASSPIYDTVKTVGENGKIDQTLPRDMLRAVQTPQAFSLELYRKAIVSYRGDLSMITDDNMLVEKIGVHPYLVETDRYNIKITTNQDFELAQMILRGRSD